MFNFTKHESSPPKCYITHGTIGHIDPKQPPTKRQPFSTILNVPFVHKIDLILPQELHTTVIDILETSSSKLKFERVILPLSAILEGEFFNEYIKRGNILMLSEGKHGVDNVYSLRNGILTLSLDKESYERAGLVGKPEGTKGKRGLRARWNVEINLRLPSMLHGKKGFDRIVYGCKNALPNPVTWLFADLDGKAHEVNPLAKYHPTTKVITPNTTNNTETVLPDLSSPIPTQTHDSAFHEVTTDLYEWLSLILLESPRLHPVDDIDPYLSRYALPIDTTFASTPTQLTKVTWHGFMSSAVAREIFVNVVARLGREAWCAMAIGGFSDSLSQEGSGGDCVVLKCGGGGNEFLGWVVEG